MNRANRPDTRPLLKRYTKSFATCYAGAIHTSHFQRLRGRQHCEPSGHSATNRRECSMSMEFLTAAASGVLRRSADNTSGRSRPHQTGGPKPPVATPCRGADGADKIAVRCGLGLSADRAVCRAELSTTSLCVLVPCPSSLNAKGFFVPLLGVRRQIIWGS